MKETIMYTVSLLLVAAAMFLLGMNVDKYLLSKKTSKIIKDPLVILNNMTIKPLDDYKGIYGVISRKEVKRVLGYDDPLPKKIIRRK